MYCRNGRVRVRSVFLVFGINPPTVVTASYTPCIAECESLALLVSSTSHAKTSSSTCAFSKRRTSRWYGDAVLKLTCCRSLDFSSLLAFLISHSSVAYTKIVFLDFRRVHRAKYRQPVVQDALHVPNFRRHIVFLLTLFTAGTVGL